MNVALEGKVYPEVRFTVEPRHVERFADAVGAPRRGVPVTFVTAAEFTCFPTIVGDPELALDFTRVLHAGQEYELSRPLRVGETLIVRSWIANARAKGGQSFLTIETTVVDETGERVATARATMLERARA